MVLVAILIPLTSMPLALFTLQYMSVSAIIPPLSCIIKYMHTSNQFKMLYTNVHVQRSK